MASTFLDQGIVALNNYGVFDYLLPFMVAFAVLYGILEKTMLFGRKNKNLNSVFATVVSLMILPFVSNLNYAVFLSKLVFLIIGFVFLAVILNMFGFKFEKMSNAIIFAFIAVGFLAATEIFGIDFNNVPDVAKYVVIAVLVFGALMWFMTKKEPVAAVPAEKKKEEKSKEKQKEAPRPAQQGINPAELLSELKQMPEDEQEEFLSQINPNAASAIRERLKRQ